MKHIKIGAFANTMIFAIPLAALCGWIFNIEVLKTFLAPNNIGMNPMSIMCFMFLGTALYWARNHTEQNIHVMLAVLPLLIGIMQVAKYTLSLNVHLDQIFFTERLKGNIMSPNAAGTFILASLSIITMRLRVYRGIALPSLLALGVGWMALLACTGYMYGVTALYGVSDYIPMALNTSLTFLFFATGMLLVKSDYEPMRTVLSDTQGGLLARWLIPPAMLFPVASAWLRMRGDGLGWYEPKLGVTLFVLINVFVWAAVLWFTAYWLYKADLKNQHLMDLLGKKAKLDPLTGLWNRRYFDERLDAAYATLERHQRPFSCIVVDVDFFKKINDNFGHAFGDFVLKKVADLLTHVCRKEDVVCRLGGEEFVIILPDTAIKNAHETAERLRAHIAQAVMENEAIAVRITCSFGIAQAVVNNKSVVELADTRLYKAKQLGRNRCVFEDVEVVQKTA